MHTLVEKVQFVQAQQGRTLLCGSTQRAAQHCRCILAAEKLAGREEHGAIERQLARHSPVH